MSGHVGFIKALTGACRGTGIFFSLRRNSWGRTILHLFLLSVLCAGGITVGQGIRTARQVRQYADLFFDAFGGIQISRDGARPVIEPEKARSRELTSDTRVFYFPAIPEKGIVLPEQELLLTDYGFIWTPKQLVTLARIPADKRWQCSTLALGWFSPSVPHVLTDAELPGYLAGLREPSDQIAVFPGLSTTLTNEDTVPVIVGTLCTGLFVVNWLVVFLQPLLYTAIFVLVFRLTGGRQLRTLSLSEFWRVGIYSGFPVMLFASCFPAFDLPFLRYDTVYMIGLVAYWLVVTGRIERANIEGGASDE
jgi:hypothetical protein